MKHLFMYLIYLFIQAWPRLEYCVDAREVKEGIRREEQEQHEEENEEEKKGQEEKEETSVIPRVEDEANVHIRPVDTPPSSPNFGLDVSAVWPTGRGALLVSEGDPI